MVKTMMQKHFLLPGFAFLPALGFVGRRSQSPLLHKRERTSEQVGHTHAHTRFHMEMKAPTRLNTHYKISQWHPTGSVMVIDTNLPTMHQ